MAIESKKAVYGTLIAVVLQSMIGLCSDKTYGAIMNYDDGDNNETKIESMTTMLLPDQYPLLIFYPITTPRSLGGLLGDNIYVRYGHGALYIYHFKDVPKTDLCKFWRFGLVSLSHEKNTGSISKIIYYIFYIYRKIPLVSCP